MKGIIEMLDALRAGAVLADPALWKRRQNAINALVAALGAALAVAAAFGLRIDASQEDLVTIASGIFGVVALANGYLTTATSTKIGIGTPQTPPEDSP